MKSQQYGYLSLVNLCIGATNDACFFSKQCHIDRIVFSMKYFYFGRELLLASCDISPVYTVVSLYVYMYLQEEHLSVENLSLEKIWNLYIPLTLK